MLNVNNSTPNAPAEKLDAHGIQAVADYAWEAIELSLIDYASRQEAEAVD